MFYSYRNESRPQVRVDPLMQRAKHAQPQNIFVQTQSSHFDKGRSLLIDGLFEISRVRRIGMLSEFSEAQMQPLIAAFRQQLQLQGWQDERINIDLRSASLAARDDGQSLLAHGTHAMPLDF
jgi:hypothetical protein